MFGFEIAFTCSAALNDEVVVLESEMTTFSQKCREVEKFQEAQLKVCEVWVIQPRHFSPPPALSLLFDDNVAADDHCVQCQMQWLSQLPRGEKDEAS